jgi:hypothetical protein
MGDFNNFDWYVTKVFMWISTRHIMKQPDYTRRTCMKLSFYQFAIKHEMLTLEVCHGNGELAKPEAETWP